MVINFQVTNLQHFMKRTDEITGLSK